MTHDQNESPWPGEELEYLEEILSQYARFLADIGQNGLSANLVLHYRTELQEALIDLEERAPLESYWRQTAELDNQLQSSREKLLGEIGLQNYRLERRQLSPPKEYWWWYLDSGLEDPNKPNPLRNWWNWMRK